MQKVKIMVIGSSTLVTGLTLAGISNSVIATEKDFESHLEAALKKQEFGILVVQENFLSKVNWRLKKKLDNLAYPVIVPVPGMGVKSEEGDDLRNLIKRALGFDMMVEK